MSATEAPAPISVLIVDDSATSRAVMTELCNRDPGMRVVGEAVDGQQAVDLAIRLRPTVVLMDITMPRLNGYEATRQIMTEAPTRIVMVTAENDPKSIEVTLRALEAGALTVLAKPCLEEGHGTARRPHEFTMRVKLLSDVSVIRRHASRSRAAAPAPAPAALDSAAKILAVATSTGGPQALEGLLSGLPPDIAVPVVVVQHIVNGFIPGLAEWLNAKVQLRVKVAAQGDRLQAGTVYLAPDNFHLTVNRRQVIALNDSPPVGGFRPSGDVLLASVAAAYGEHAIAAVLTGMGSDGLEGARAVSEAGGTVLAQDEVTSVVYGMPRAASDAGLADFVGPVEALARRIVYLSARRKP